MSAEVIGGRGDSSSRSELKVLQVIAAVTVIATYLLPLNQMPSICLFFYLTGLPCPGCGLTRATGLITHGHWFSAFELHPFAFPATIWILLLILSIFSERLRGLYLNNIKAIHKMYITAGALMLVFGMARIILILTGHMQFLPPK